MKRDKSIQAVIRRARAQGRAEAVNIIARICPEDGIDGLVRSSPNGESGDYSSYWDLAALRKLLCADTEVCDKIDRLAGAHEWVSYLEFDLAKAREELALAKPNAARYQHLKATWEDGGLLERLDANVKPEHWDATIDADMANCGRVRAEIEKMTMGLDLSEEQILEVMANARRMNNLERLPLSVPDSAEFNAAVRSGAEAMVGTVMAPQMFPGAYRQPSGDTHE
jgi:hypothetical protein